MLSVHYHWRSVAEQSSSAGLAVLFGVCCLTTVVLMFYAWMVEEKATRAPKEPRYSPTVEPTSTTPPEVATSPPMKQQHKAL
ncbi:MAG: hypothetical protein Q8P67_19660, partial [archaeon]|nr:hypothetical protein [archaeon]